jgi:NADH-quinone oxidoreductase subunit M
VLAVQSCALYLFLATDVFLFYVFFEVILIPMYFLIGGFGPGPRSIRGCQVLDLRVAGRVRDARLDHRLYVQSARAGASYC